MYTVGMDDKTANAIEQLADCYRHNGYLRGLDGWYILYIEPDGTAVAEFQTGRYTPDADDDRLVLQLPANQLTDDVANSTAVRALVPRIEEFLAGEKNRNK